MYGFSVHRKRRHGTAPSWLPLLHGSLRSVAVAAFTALGATTTLAQRPAMPAAGTAPAAVGEIGVASVRRLVGAAMVVRAGKNVSLEVGGAVKQQERVTTAAGGRLLLVFRDGSELTLGERASVTVDSYVFEQRRTSARVILGVAQGAFRFATGRIGKLADKRIEVRTPAATLAVRGTDFWGGQIDGSLGVLVLRGRVVVRNAGGSVLLNRRGLGTSVADRETAPTRARKWPDAKVRRALATIAMP